MLNPSSVNTQHLTIESGARLRPGAVVTAKVVESLPGGRFTLLWNGRRIRAESRLRLSIGESIRARVEEGGNGPLRLSLLTDPLASANSNSSNPTTLREQSLFLASLLRAGSGLPDESEVARRLALLSHARGRRIGLSRLYAELLSRGADPTADFLEALESLLFGGGRPPGTQKKKRGQREMGWNEVPGANKLAEEWKGETDSHPLLELFSGVEGRSGQWIFKRIHRFYKGRDTDMILKIRRGANPALALTVHDEGRTLEFLLEGISALKLAVFSDNPDSIGEEAWSTFRKRLALMNVDVNGAISAISESDGFTVGAMDTAWEMEARY